MTTCDNHLYNIYMNLILRCRNRCQKDVTSGGRGDKALREAWEELCGTADSLVVNLGRDHSIGV